MVHGTKGKQQAFLKMRMVKRDKGKITNFKETIGWERENISNDSYKVVLTLKLVCKGHILLLFVVSFAFDL